MNGAASVLIIDHSNESRVVLRTALERRGMRILEARRSDVGLALARKHRPDLIVLDLDALPARRPAAAEFAAAAENAGGRLLILGTAARSAEASCDQFMAKPYHYQPLIHKIEELLRQRLDRVA